MKVLVLNCGSSSVKFQLLDMTDETRIAKGLVEKVGQPDAIVNYQRYEEPKYREIMPVQDHDVAIRKITEMITDPRMGVLRTMDEIGAVGHRMVHGGEEFADSVIVNDEVIAKVLECCELAPLHNPHNLRGLRAAQKALPQAPQVAVFDTAFHQRMPKMAYMYGLPYEIYTNHRIRRYGFHGTSHYYISRRAAQMIGRPIEELKIVTCHLGNGASIAAVKHGVSVDTSMGFTPLEGLVMGTRCGDIDPAIVPYLQEKLGLSPAAMSDYLNKKCGVWGLSELSIDMRDIEDAHEAGNERATLVLQIYCYRIIKYVGAYAAAMGGIDALVFTGGVGENSPLTRSWVCKELGFMDIRIDEVVNDVKARSDLSVGTGRVAVLVIPTNEELVIAQESRRLVEAGAGTCH